MDDVSRQLDQMHDDLKRILELLRGGETPTTPQRTSSLTRIYLTDEQVLSIRKRWAGGENVTDIARDYHITDPALGKVVHGESYRHVPYIPPHGRTDYRARQKHAVRESIARDIRDGLTRDELIRKYGVRPAIVESVLVNMNGASS